jgi:hypothetical protein
MDACVHVWKPQNEHRDSFHNELVYVCVCGCIWKWARKLHRVYIYLPMCTHTYIYIKYACTHTLQGHLNASITCTAARWGCGHPLRVPCCLAQRQASVVLSAVVRIEDVENLLLIFRSDVDYVFWWLSGLRGCQQKNRVIVTNTCTRRERPLASERPRVAYMVGEFSTVI